ncbi:Ppx/GppA phosphatase family protein [Jatrophihabitans fulvus]
MNGRVAAIDCGTNSLRLLIADADAGGLSDIVRDLRIVRLGQDVDRTGRLAPEALERTRAVLVEYAAAIREHGAQRVRMVATSATRDASNRDEFTELVRDVLGVTPDVVTGHEEAALSFAGAAGVRPDAAGPLLVLDIGGGSTELVLGERGGELRAHSMDVGSVRLTERHLHDDPPTADQVAAVVADVQVALELARADVPLDPGSPLVGVAGTVTTLAAVALELDDPRQVHGAVVTAGQVDEVAERLVRMPRSEREAVKAIHPGRVDVIGAGATVLRTVMAATGAPELVVSTHDILDGIALGLLD